MRKRSEMSSTSKQQSSSSTSSSTSATTTPQTAGKTTTTATMPSTTLPNCAVLINDRQNALLGAIVDQLGTLEDGALCPVEEILATGNRLFQLAFDTKYYQAQVPVWSYPSFEVFAESIGTRRPPKEQIQALLVCAERSELSLIFMARVGRIASDLEPEVEVKALVVKSSYGDEGSSRDEALNAQKMDVVVNDAQLNKFCIQRGIELIQINADSGKKQRQQRPDLAADDAEDEDEEGTSGVARVVEVLQTIHWAGLRLKPNPLGSSALEHRQRLAAVRAQLEEEEEERRMLAAAGFTSGGGGRKGPSFGQFRKLPAPVAVANAGRVEVVPMPKAGDDCPDSEDEEAILEWFSQTIT